MVGAYSGCRVRILSSAPHSARAWTVGMSRAAAALSWTCGVPTTASAALVPGSTRSSRTSLGCAPERVTTSASIPVLGPVHTGSVPPRTRAPGVPGVDCPGSCTTISDHSPQVPATDWARIRTTVSVTVGSYAHVTPTRENSSVPVRLTDNAGRVPGTPATALPVSARTSAPGAGPPTEPIGMVEAEVSTGEGWVLGAAWTGTTRMVALNVRKATAPVSIGRTRGTSVAGQSLGSEVRPVDLRPHPEPGHPGKAPPPEATERSTGEAHWLIGSSAQAVRNTARQDEECPRSVRVSAPSIHAATSPDSTRKASSVLV